MSNQNIRLIQIPPEQEITVEAMFAFGLAVSSQKATEGRLLIYDNASEKLLTYDLSSQQLGTTWLPGLPLHPCSLALDSRLCKACLFLNPNLHMNPDLST